GRVALRYARSGSSLRLGPRVISGARHEPGCPSSTFDRWALWAVVTPDHVTDIPNTRPTQKQEEQFDVQSGTLVAGRYRLDERLAAGGMGEVWKGFDTRLSRNVAVKILHAGLSSNDKFRARFQLEARAVAALQSPGIVALYDYGEETGDEGLISYLVMELVPGRS